VVSTREILVTPALEAIPRVPFVVESFFRLNLSEYEVVAVPELANRVQSPELSLAVKNAWTLLEPSEVCHSTPQVADPFDANLPAWLSWEPG
jgi:hypothetical protein